MTVDKHCASPTLPLSIPPRIETVVENEEPIETDFVCHPSVNQPINSTTPLCDVNNDSAMLTENPVFDSLPINSQQQLEVLDSVSPSCNARPSSKNTRRSSKSQPFSIVGLNVAGAKAKLDLGILDNYLFDFAISVLVETNCNEIRLKDTAIYDFDSVFKVA